MSFLSGLLLGLVLAVLLAVLLQRLVSFGAQRPADYAGQGPAFLPARHLAGLLVMDGVIYGPTGRVTSRFAASAQGDWTGDRGTLRESFVYGSGRWQEREWRLQVFPDGRIEGKADDVIGTAKGWVSGNAVQMRYRLRLPTEAGGHVLSVTDWMYLTPECTIVNRSQFFKAGIRVAELVASIRPVSAALARTEQTDMAAE